LINYRYYFWYKFFNSLFLGLSVGSIFVIYTPLKPSMFSLGGVALAIGMLIVAKFYEKIMNIRYFFYITMLVELTVLGFVIFFLLFKYSYMSALTVYLGYQLTFVFGSYLVRMETVALKRTSLLSFADIAKQKGYLLGLILSYIFYKILEYFGIIKKQIQVYDLYMVALIVQIIIVLLVMKSFRKQ